LARATGISTALVVVFARLFARRLGFAGHLPAVLFQTIALRLDPAVVAPPDDDFQGVNVPAHSVVTSSSRSRRSKVQIAPNTLCVKAWELLRLRNHRCRRLSGIAARISSAAVSSEGIRMFFAA